MTSSMAVVGLTYDGVDLQVPEDGIFLEILHGLNETPSVRGVDTTVPALPGTVEGNRVNHTLKINLVGLVHYDESLTTNADRAASYRTNERLVRVLFRPARARADLVALLEDGATATISARPLPTMTWDEHPGNHAHPDIELEGNGDWVYEAGP